MTLVDKAIGYFSPKYAYSASRYREAANFFGNGIYKSAVQSPHYDIQNFDTSEDEDLYDLQTLRATSREKYKNNGFYKGIIQAATDHTIGSGLYAKSTISRRLIPNLTEQRAKDIESMFDDYFNSWSESTICDVTGKDNFYSIQRLAYKTYKRDGDSFTLLPLTNIGDSKVIQIDMVGAENIYSNERDFVEGIKTSDSKLPLEYSIYQKNNTFKKVKAFSKGKRNMLHIFDRERSKQLRGIPFLTPVMRDIDAIDQYMTYEMTAAKLSSIFFGSITSASKDSAFGDGELDLTTGEQLQKAENTVKQNSITQLHPGDELNIHHQGRDNPNFDKFVMTNLKKVSTDTRIPLEIILAQFVSSYSASRAAMLQMMKFVNPERMLFVNSFCKPTREQVITWGILNGDLVVPDFFDNRTAYLRAIWIGDPMGSVDPQKDVKAKVSAIDNFLLTREQATVELGYGDFETNIDILKKEAELIKPLLPEEVIV